MSTVTVENPAMVQFDKLVKNMNETIAETQKLFTSKNREIYDLKNEVRFQEERKNHWTAECLKHKGALVSSIKWGWVKNTIITILVGAIGILCLILI